MFVASLNPCSSQNTPVGLRSDHLSCKYSCCNCSAVHSDLHTSRHKGHCWRFAAPLRSSVHSRQKLWLQRVVAATAPRGADRITAEFRCPACCPSAASACASRGSPLCRTQRCSGAMRSPRASCAPRSRASSACSPRRTQRCTSGAVGARVVPALLVHRATCLVRLVVRPNAAAQWGHAWSVCFSCTTRTIIRQVARLAGRSGATRDHCTSRVSCRLSGLPEGYLIAARASCLSPS